MRTCTLIKRNVVRKGNQTLPINSNFVCECSLRSSENPVSRFVRAALRYRRVFINPPRKLCTKSERECGFVLVFPLGLKNLQHKYWISVYGRRFCFLESYVEEVQPCAVDIDDNLTLVWLRLWDINRKGYI